MQYTTLAGSGCALGATSITLTSFKDIDGVNLSISSFGTKGYMTLEPSNASQEEQILFTGITQNANGTATLTGVKTVLFITPFTETSGTAKAHPGGSKAVVSNTSAFYNALASELNTETVVGVWTFPNGANRPRIDADTDTALATGLVTLGQLSRQAISGASDASTTVKGIVQLPHQSDVDNKSTTGSTAALFAVTPDKLRATKYNDYVVDTGAVNAYAIAPTPVVTLYTAGLEFRFKVARTNTGASTLAVNGLATKAITKNRTLALNGGELTTNYIAGVIYDGTQFQLQESAIPKVSIDAREVYGVSTGVGTAYAVGLAPVATAYTAGLVVRFKPDTASSGGATLNVNSLGAKTIVRGGIQVSTLTANDIPANAIATVVYDGTSFQLQNPSGGTSKKKIDTTNVSIASSTTETNIVSMWLPGLVLGTNNAVKITASLSVLRINASKTCVFNLKYGGTTCATMTMTNSEAGTLTTNGGRIEALLIANASASAQEGSIYGVFGNGTAAAAGAVSNNIANEGVGTATIDSTARQALIISATFNNSSSSDNLVLDHYIVEQIS